MALDAILDAAAHAILYRGCKFSQPVFECCRRQRFNRRHSLTRHILGKSKCNQHDKSVVGHYRPAAAAIMTPQVWPKPSMTPVARQFPSALATETDRATWTFVPTESATQAQIDAGNNVIATIPVDPLATVSTGEFIARWTNAEYKALQLRRTRDNGKTAKDWDNVTADDRST